MYSSLIACQESKV